MKYIFGLLLIVIFVALSVWFFTQADNQSSAQALLEGEPTPANVHTDTPITTAPVVSPVPSSTPERQVYGVIIDADDSSAVAGAEILLLSVEADEGVKRQVFSDTDGTFRFRNVPTGHYFLLGRYQRKLTFTHQDELVPLIIGTEDRTLGPMNLQLYDDLSTLTVKVIDGEQNAPIADALVRAASRVSFIDQTNQIGLVEMTLSQEPWLIEATAVGYAKASRMIQPSQRSMEIDLILRSGSTLTGQVTDPQGVPIAEAQINLRGPNQRHRTTSDKHGKYRVENLAQTAPFQVSISAAGYQKINLRNFTLPSEKAALVKNWVLQPVAPSNKQRVFVEGQVTGPDHEPAAGVKVFVQVGKNRFISQATDEDGNFRFGNIQRNAFPLQMGAGGAGFAFRQFVIQEPPADPLTIRLAFGDFVGGSVVDDAGQPLPGVAIRVDTFPPEKTFYDGRPFFTDDSGRFLIEGLRKTDEPSFTFSAKGYSTLYGLALTLNSDDNRLTLPSLGSIHGNVINEDGEPVTAYNIRVFNTSTSQRNPPPEGDMRLAREGLHFSNPAGTFRIDGLDTNEIFSLYVEAKDLASEFKPMVPAMRLEDPPITITMNDETIRAAGILVDNAGLPIAGQKLQLELFDDAAFLPSLGNLPLEAGAFHLGFLDARAVTSNEQGRFAFEALPADLSMRIVVRRDGWRAEPITDIATRTAKQRENLVITMVPAARLYGLVNLETYGARPELSLAPMGHGDPQWRHKVVDADGRYAFENLNNQRYQLALRGTSPQGPIEETLIIELIQGQAMELNLGFDQRYDLNGQIWLGDQTYANGDFQIIPVDNGMQPLPPQQTNESGQFKVSGLRNGQHQLRLHKQTHTGAQAESNNAGLVRSFQIDREDLVQDFHFAAFGELRGQIGPVPLQTTELVLIDHETGHRKHRTGIAIDGTFHFPMVLTGQYDLILEIIHAEHSERKTLMQQIKIHPAAMVNLGKIQLATP